MTNEQLKQILKEYGQEVINASMERGSWSLEEIADETIEKLEQEQQVKNNCVHPFDYIVGDGIVNPIDCNKCGKRLQD